MQAGRHTYGNVKMKKHFKVIKNSVLNVSLERSFRRGTRMQAELSFCQSSTKACKTWRRQRERGMFTKSGVPGNTKVLRPCEGICAQVSADRTKDSAIIRLLNQLHERKWGWKFTHVFPRRFSNQVIEFLNEHLFPNSRPWNVEMSTAKAMTRQTVHSKNVPPLFSHKCTWAKFKSLIFHGRLFSYFQVRPVKSCHNNKPGAIPLLHFWFFFSNLCQNWRVPVNFVSFTFCRCRTAPRSWWPDTFQQLWESAGICLPRALWVSPHLVWLLVSFFCCHCKTASSLVLVKSQIHLSNYREGKHFPCRVHSHLYCYSPISCNTMLLTSLQKRSAKQGRLSASKPLIGDARQQQW